jgi:hypothetical protein
MFRASVRNILDTPSYIECKKTHVTCNTKYDTLGSLFVRLHQVSPVQLPDKDSLNIKILQSFGEMTLAKINLSHCQSFHHKSHLHCPGTEQGYPR